MFLLCGSFGKNLGYLPGYVGKIIDVYVVPSDTKPEPVTGTPQLSRLGLTTLSSDSRPPPAPEKNSALGKKTLNATTAVTTKKTTYGVIWVWFKYGACVKKIYINKNMRKTTETKEVD